MKVNPDMDPGISPDEANFSHRLNTKSENKELKQK